MWPGEKKKVRITYPCKYFPNDFYKVLKLFIYRDCAWANYSALEKETENHLLRQLFLARAELRPALTFPPCLVCLCTHVNNRQTTNERATAQKNNKQHSQMII